MRCSRWFCKSPQLTKCLGKNILLNSLTYIKAPGYRLAHHLAMEWQPIAAAPFDRDLEVAVIGYDGTHALVFPCRRIVGGWIDAKTKVRLTIYPSHWREWQPLDGRTLKNA